MPACCQAELRLDDRGKHGSGALDVVVANHVAEPVGLLELPTSKVDPLPDLTRRFRRTLAQPSFELGHVRTDEDRDAAGHMLLHGERTFELELEDAHTTFLGNAVDL